MLRHSRELAEICLKLKIGRLAVVGHDPISLSIALVALHQIGGEVLVHRGQLPSGRGLVDELKDLGVNGWFDGERVHSTQSGSRAPSTFGLLIPTSGTTGTPKWVTHSLEALLSSAEVKSSTLAGSKFLMSFHVATFAGIQFLLSAMTAGAELCYTEQNSISSLADFAHRFPPNVISGTPSFWRAFLLAMGKEAALLPLRNVTLGGEIVDQNILDALRSRYPETRIRHIYATTEFGALAPVDDGKAGLPADWLERKDMEFQIAIVDGHLYVGGKRASQHCAKDTAGHLSEGIVLADTGDLVELRDERILFKGRADSMINVGGHKINPEEVELALLDVPGVLDAFVYAHPSALLGSVVVADLMLDSTVDRPTFRELALRNLSKTLPRHKLPVRFNEVTSVDRSVAGKLRRVKMHHG
ncbi:class I adenylate-forming enzyme family protein [Bradyrhizobium prioriisuperbiae]|uniref:class I adenylate-forming enzyme family protein n=1 Tax=Bradyrhizobium prioriisuperbiae TaxID=2854389 RepID=UPI0028E6F3AA|nr:class I adenylate-forming enzyme family protein [Bradyrhizobium prioritasuperba]